LRTAEFSTKNLALFREKAQSAWYDPRRSAPCRAAERKARQTWLTLPASFASAGARDHKKRPASMGDRALLRLIRLQVGALGAPQIKKSFRHSAFTLPVNG